MTKHTITSATNNKFRRHLNLVATITTFLYFAIFALQEFNFNQTSTLTAQANMTQNIELALAQDVQELTSEVLLNRTIALRDRINSLTLSLQASTANHVRCLNLRSSTLSEEISSCETSDHQAPSVIVPLKQFAQDIGQIHVYVHSTKPQSFTSILTGQLKNLITAIIASLSITWIIYFLTKRTIIHPLTSEIKRREHDSAIAQSAEMLAHDVRKPFVMLKMLVNELTATQGDQNKNRARELLIPKIHNVHSQVQRMTEDVLDLKRRESLSLQTVDLHLMFEKAIQQTIESNQIAKSLSIIIHGKVRAVVDPAKFSRIIENLLSNAVEACKGNGWIRIDLLQNESGVCIKIANSSRHLDRSTLSKVFTPYYTYGKKGGTGLGLAIVKKFVELHHGKITASNLPGPAVLFAITLPPLCLKTHAAML
jgi:signal transduction histidine kinase